MTHEEAESVVDRVIGRAAAVRAAIVDAIASGELSVREAMAPVPPQASDRDFDGKAEPYVPRPIELAVATRLRAFAKQEHRRASCHLEGAEAARNRAARSERLVDQVLRGFVDRPDLLLDDVFPEMVLSMSGQEST